MDFIEVSFLRQARDTINEYLENLHPDISAVIILSTSKVKHLLSAWQDCLD